MVSIHSFHKANTLPIPAQPNPPPILPHRRVTTINGVAAGLGRKSFLQNTLLLATISPVLMNIPNPANAFELRLTVPDQTLEEAELGIQSHARSLLKVKDLLAEELWKEAQKSLRKSSALLKQDFYTIIQGKPPDERPRLRKLYSDLFDAVTGLDYAARDKDKIRVWDCYNTIVLSLNNILSRV